VLVTQLTRIKDLQLLLFNVLKNGSYKINSLEGEKKKVAKKFIGLSFNMEDYKTTTLEAQEAFSKVELEIEHL
jgi:hypothetical protein